MSFHGRPNSFFHRDILPHGLPSRCPRQQRGDLHGVVLPAPAATYAPEVLCRGNTLAKPLRDLATLRDLQLKLLDIVEPQNDTSDYCRADELHTVAEMVRMAMRADRFARKVAATFKFDPVRCRLLSG